MGIEISGETIVSKLLYVKVCTTKVCGFIHASGCHDSDQFVEEGVTFTTQPVKTLGQLLWRVEVKLVSIVLYNLF